VPQVEAIVADPLLDVSQCDGVTDAKLEVYSAVSSQAEREAFDIPEWGAIAGARDVEPFRGGGPTETFNAHVYRIRVVRAYFKDIVCA
jgi:hypothetical protein